MKALSIARDKGIPATAFKASNGWIQHFMKRNNLSLRHRTMMCQRLPEEYDEKLLSLQKFVIEKHREHEYLLPQIGNADQTPVWFEAPENMTVEVKGTKCVRVLTTGPRKTAMHGECFVLLLMAVNYAIRCV